MKLLKRLIMYIFIFGGILCSMLIIMPLYALVDCMIGIFGHILSILMITGITSMIIWVIWLVNDRD